MKFILYLCFLVEVVGFMGKVDWFFILLFMDVWFIFFFIGFCWWFGCMWNSISWCYSLIFLLKNIIVCCLVCLFYWLVLLFLFCILCCSWKVLGWLYWKYCMVKFFWWLLFGLVLFWLWFMLWYLVFMGLSGYWLWKILWFWLLFCF